MFNKPTEEYSGISIGHNLPTEGWYIWGSKSLAWLVSQVGELILLKDKVSSI